MRRESYGTMMHRALKKIRKMPARTLRDRELRAEALEAAIADWERRGDKR